MKFFEKLLTQIADLGVLLFKQSQLEQTIQDTTNRVLTHARIHTQKILRQIKLQITQGILVLFAIICLVTGSILLLGRWFAHDIILIIFGLVFAYLATLVYIMLK